MSRLGSRNKSRRHHKDNTSGRKELKEHALFSQDTLVGCCGTAGLALKDYAKRFRVIEVQSTFYRLPKPETARRWKESTLGQDFEFTLKAFQGITHPLESPTWRRAGPKDILEKVRKEDVGFLRESSFVLKCLRSIIEIAKILESRVIVFQMPPSFEYSQGNLESIEKFFTHVLPSAISSSFSSSQRSEVFSPALELRHWSWFSEKSRLWDLAGKISKARESRQSLAPLLVTDPLRDEQRAFKEILLLQQQQIAYHRLHGLGRSFTNYKYKYADTDLRNLLDSVLSARRLGTRQYILFNNISMRDDAERFSKLLVSTLS